MMRTTTLVAVVLNAPLVIALTAQAAVPFRLAQYSQSYAAPSDVYYPPGLINDRRGSRLPATPRAPRARGSSQAPRASGLAHNFAPTVLPSIETITREYRDWGRAPRQGIPIRSRPLLGGQSTTKKILKYPELVQTIPGVSAAPQLSSAGPSAAPTSNNLRGGLGQTGDTAYGNRAPANRPILPDVTPLAPPNRSPARAFLTFPTGGSTRPLRQPSGFAPLPQAVRSPMYIDPPAPRSLSTPSPFVRREEGQPADRAAKLARVKEIEQPISDIQSRSGAVPATDPTQTKNTPFTPTWPPLIGIGSLAAPDLAGMGLPKSPLAESAETASETGPTRPLWGTPGTVPLDLSPPAIGVPWSPSSDGAASPSLSLPPTPFLPRPGFDLSAEPSLPNLIGPSLPDVTPGFRVSPFVPDRDPAPADPFSAIPSRPLPSYDSLNLPRPEYASPSAPPRPVFWQPAGLTPPGSPAVPPAIGAVPAPVAPMNLPALMLIPGGFALPPLGPTPVPPPSAVMQMLQSF